jgi:uncharacterized protein (DUF305 family)
MKKLWIVFGLLAVILTVFTLPVALADAPVDGRTGRAEVRFLQGMIDHHQMALDMAADCLEKASTESVVTLCQNVIDAQSAEIELMQGWLLDWYNIDYSPMSMLDMLELMDMMDDGMGAMHGGHGGMSMGDMPYTDPPMMMGMFAGFNRLEGVEYEVAWLESMIDHHDDALHMAERLLLRVPEGAGHADLRELAQQIIADQTAEIDAMEVLIAELSA